MNIKGSIVKSLLSLVVCGSMAFFANSAFAKSGSGMDLTKLNDNFGIVATIEEATGKVFTGSVFYVDSSSTLDRDVASSGSFRTPFSTIDYAIGRATARTANSNPTANSGSLILVGSGHTNTAMSSADEIDVDLAGLTIWGIGSGADRPTLTYTVAAGELTIGANNVTVGNIIFISSVTDVLKAINVETGMTDTRIVNCLFGVDTTGTDEFADCINLSGTNTRALIRGNTMNMGLGGAVAGIHIDDDCVDVTIEDNVIKGDYSTANIVGDTTLSNTILIRDNVLVNGSSGALNAQPGIELLTGSTGIIADNYVAANLATVVASIVADECIRFENYYCEDTGTGTGALIGTASIDD